MRARWRIAVFAVALAAVAPLAAQDLGTDAERERGKELYDKYCSQCHGDTGDGNGYATNRVKPAPRDFTSGKYKFRTTPSGMAPTDADIARVIKDGLPYTSMPGWPMFSDADIQNIVYYLKTFSDTFQNPDMLAAPIDIPEPPAMTEESIARGSEVYVEQGCGACHGELGRGDGMSAKTLQDDWGNHIRPADMHKRWTFRGGPTRKDIYRTFSTGVNGTPMPSYGETLAEQDRWDLVNYIYSLADSDTPDYSDLVIVDYVEDELDISDPETLFANAPMSRFATLGQIVEPARSFYPAVNSVEVRAVYNRKEIAILVQWNDISADTSGSNSPLMEALTWDEDNPGAASGGAEGEDFWGADVAGEEADEGDFWGADVAEEEADEGDFWGADVAEDEGGDDFWGEDEGDSGGSGEGFSDAVAIQFPSQLPSGIRKPYFLMGDTQSAVDIWFSDLAQNAQLAGQFTARGRDSIEAVESDEIEIVSSFDNGQWSVVFKRQLKSRGGITFEEDQYVPLSFAVWDGFNRERGAKRTLTSWFYLYTEPVEVVSPVAPMIKAGLIALVVELLVIFFIRRRYRGAPAESRPAPPPIAETAT